MNHLTSEFHFEDSIPFYSFFPPDEMIGITIMSLDFLVVTGGVTSCAGKSLGGARHWQQHHNECCNTSLKCVGQLVYCCHSFSQQKVRLHISPSTTDTNNVYLKTCVLFFCLVWLALLFGHAWSPECVLYVLWHVHIS